MDINQIVLVFKKSRIFDGLGDEDLKKMATGCSEQSFPIGTVIIEENDPPKEMLYVIRQGEIVVSVAQAIVDSCEGADGSAMITTLGEGDAFGEIAIIDEMPHSATVTAMSDSIVILLPMSHFYSLVEKDKNIGYVVIRNLAKLICQRLRGSNFLTKHFVSWGVPDAFEEQSKS
ncbi:MAG TPA: cyclic nucleotide-binding domain-containing protein [bacterium]|nr:cyclic nucleotide-binding domain-containing protein [bacterium]